MNSVGTLRAKLDAKLRLESLELSKLYHGTTKDKVDGIMVSGLLPDLTRGDEPYVFLSELPRIAMMFAPGGRYCPDKEIANAALLEVNLPVELQEKLITEGEFIRCPFAIQPRFIKVTA